jgi:hypothetical protein
MGCYERVPQGRSEGVRKEETNRQRRTDGDVGRMTALVALYFWVAAELWNLLEGYPFDNPSADVLGGAAKMAGGRECYAGRISGLLEGSADDFLGDWNHSSCIRWDVDALGCFGSWAEL